MKYTTKGTEAPRITCSSVCFLRTSRVQAIIGTSKNSGQNAQPAIWFKSIIKDVLRAV